MAVMILLGALIVLVWPGVATGRGTGPVSSRYLWAGRAVVALAAILARPAFVSSVVFIVSV
ncbi:hypothetical protein M1E17_20125 [Arthrobacter sp. D1-29]